MGGLANNGGPTQTIAILPGSPATNTGAAIGYVTTAQRGTVRPQGSAPDTEAFERVGISGTAHSAGYEFATRQAINCAFSDDASVTFGRVSMTLTNLTTNHILPPNTGSLQWNAKGTQATLVLTNLLADDNYLASTIGPAGTIQVDFFVLAGDVNHDRAVNFDDLLLLAQN